MHLRQHRTAAGGIHLLVILILALSMAGIPTQTALAVSTLTVNQGDLACSDAAGPGDR